MVRLLIDDVTLLKADAIQAHVRLKGGATRTMILSRPRRAWELRKTDRAIVETIDRWLDDQTDGQRYDGHRENRAWAGRKTWRPGPSGYLSGGPSSTADGDTSPGTLRRLLRASRSR